jgi:hypothetical protein
MIAAHHFALLTASLNLMDFLFFAKTSLADVTGLSALLQHCGAWHL